jgi:hypothetical protein
MLAGRWLVVFLSAIRIPLLGYLALHYADRGRTSGQLNLFGLWRQRV